MDRNVHGLHATLDDATQVLVVDIGERDKVALEEGEAEVVVAKRERRAGVFGKHAHEAELAGVPARTDAIEEDVGKLDAPVLPQIALERAGKGSSGTNTSSSAIWSEASQRQEMMSVSLAPLTESMRMPGSSPASQAGLPSSTNLIQAPSARSLVEA